MELCLYTDSVAKLSFDDALDLAMRIGAQAVEIGAGGHSSAPHMRVHELLEDAEERSRYARKITSRGLRLSAINCSAWLMHPWYGGESLDLVRATIRLAGELEVDKIVTMSGCPGDTAGTRTVNWISYPWHPDGYAVLDEQWGQAIDLWGELAEFARQHGVERIALELIPLELAYNVPTLLRLREAVGPTIGANVDPSHLFWQQMDPPSVVRALGPAVHHAHLKDVEMRDRELAIAGVLDPRPFTDPHSRAWNFRAVGQGHSAAFWSSFLGSLREVGYDDVVSIENEDPFLPEEAGTIQAADYITDLLNANQ